MEGPDFSGIALRPAHGWSSLAIEAVLASDRHAAGSVACEMFLDTPVLDAIGRKGRQKRKPPLGVSRKARLCRARRGIAIDDDRVTAAARAVHAEPFILRLPAGYASAVAERGSTLSVGQKQLLSFARALAFDPRVLVLDEATSSVDTETELMIRDALRVLMAERTTIAIAHRLSTIQGMDKILVLHKGQLRESGTHQELLAQRGIYHRLYQLQFKDKELVGSS
jgi:ABC-type glutathione transport system ATPase component